MSRHIEDKLYDIETYAGTRLADKAHDELHAYMSALEENKSIFNALKAYNPNLIKDAEQVFKEQECQVEQVHGKERDLGM